MPTPAAACRGSLPLAKRLPKREARDGRVRVSSAPQRRGSNLKGLGQRGCSFLGLGKRSVEGG